MIDHHGEPADTAEITVAVADLEETDHQERCTRLHVQNVEKNVKFHSNQLDKNQFIVMNVSKTINQKEATVAVADLADVAVADIGGNRGGGGYGRDRDGGRGGGRFGGNRGGGRFGRQTTKRDAQGYMCRMWKRM